MIALNNISTGYEVGQPLLENFTYEFQNDKMYGILGRSGIGKTTILRTVAGLTKPLSGEVLIDGKPNGKPQNNNVFMMHQGYTSFDWRTCIDNILLAKEIKGKVTQEDKDEALKLLTKVHLEDYANKYPKQLSGGMRQRLALARTLYMKPEILLMDEPLSALDGDTRDEMQELIVDVHKRTHNIIIMVTHSKEEARKLCDVVIDFNKQKED